MNSEGFLTAVILTAPLVVLAVFDVNVARRIHSRDYPPRIWFIRLLRYIVDGITIGAICSAILGVSSVVFNALGVRLAPFPVSLVLIYVGVAAGSLSLIPLKRRMDVWTAEDATNPLSSEEAP